MNPKFRDLQIQAFAECKTFEDGQFRTDEVFERFAELIVRECISVYERDPSVYHEVNIANILEHFGVEE